MKKLLPGFSIFFFFLLTCSNLFSITCFNPNYSFFDENKGCIKVDVNQGEGIFHIVIAGTKEGEGTFTIKNSSGETILVQQIKCWTETTVIDLPSDGFQKGNYSISFQSAGLNCDVEFTY